MDSHTTIVRNCFANRLKELRGDMSQTELADALGVSRASLSLYELGNRTPDIEFLYTVCRYFEVTSDWLLGLSSVKKPDTTMQAVCDMTGLEYAAIEKLRTTALVKRKHGYDDYFLNLVNKFVLSKKSNHLAGRIHDITRESRNIGETYNVPYYSPEAPIGKTITQSLPILNHLREQFGTSAHVLIGADYFDYAITSAKNLAAEIVAELIEEKAIRSALDVAMEEYEKRIEEAENGDRDEKEE